METDDLEEHEFFNMKHINKDAILSIQRYENLFEDAVKNVIKQLKDNIIILDNKRKEVSEKINNCSRIDEEIPTDEEIDLSDDLGGIIWEQQWYDEQLYALNEMRAIYMFKGIEIGMKSLIKMAYPKTNVKGFYHWDNMLTFFLEKGIKLSDLPGYSEIIQLKKLNNNLKHSDVLEGDTKKIPEFVNESILPDDFDVFFKRVEPMTKQFQESVTGEVVKELYEFDDKKLDALSLELYERMEKKDAAKFVEKLKTKFLLK
jgi:hypothetical protein